MAKRTISPLLKVPRIGKKSTDNLKIQQMLVSALEEAEQMKGKSQVTNNLFEKVKKFHSNEIFGMKNLPFNNFVYYTKGNEFLGGPGRR